jgi:hypothetical protein
MIEYNVLYKYIQDTLIDFIPLCPWNNQNSITLSVKHNYKFSEYDCLLNIIPTTNQTHIFTESISLSFMPHHGT